MMEIDYGRTIFSPRWFMENILHIVNKEGETIPFRLNEEQDEMMRHIEFCLANEIPIRIRLLKARQIGATTFFTGFGYWLASMNRNTSYGIVAHRLDSAQSIFDKTKMFYNYTPKELRPKTTQFSSEAIKFDRKDGSGINSKIQFATAGEGVFRGQTLTFLHKSESAFWEGEIQAINNSLSPTIPNKAGTIIVEETTANGYNHFKDEWDRTVRGETDYTGFFFGWQDHREYRMKVPRGFELTDEEQRIKKRFKLEDEQIVWRRYQIDNEYNGNAVWFQQEYPMTPEEAFLASGSSVFGSETIKTGYEHSCEPIEKRMITSYPTHEKLLIWENPCVEHSKIYAKKAEWSFEQQKYVYIDTDLVVEERTYKTPYTVSIDTAGLGADRNQVVVIKNTTKEYVARFGQKEIPEEGLASIAVEIARLYNDAMIVPEVNFSHEICNYILKLGYKNIYITENVTRQSKPITGVIEYGWKTTGLTKAPMISSLRARLTANPELIPDREFWNEAEYFLITDISKNKMEAASGHRDDIVIATGIGMYVSDSFQSQQTAVIIKEEPTNNFLFNFAKKQSKTQKLRKGIYRNNA